MLFTSLQVNNSRRNDRVIKISTNNLHIHMIFFYVIQWRSVLRSTVEKREFLSEKFQAIANLWLKNSCIYGPGSEQLVTYIFIRVKLPKLNLIQKVSWSFFRQGTLLPREDVSWARSFPVEFIRSPKVAWWTLTGFTRGLSGLSCF